MPRQKGSAEKRPLSLETTREEWQAVQTLIASYRNQCRFGSHQSEMLVRLQSFQEKLTQLLEENSPDDYMI